MRKTVDKKTALDLAWKQGHLGYKLKPHQRDVYAKLWEWVTDPQVMIANFNCGRRWGKTFTLLTAATQYALRIPHAAIRIAAPHGNQLRRALVPNMRLIMSDCPQALRPKYHAAERYWEYPNGSEIHIVGVNDGHEDNLRGTSTNLAIVDEAGFIDNLTYVLNDVLLPQLLTTGGTLIISSTPPPSPAHPYVQIANECKAAGHQIHRTTEEADYSPEQLALMAQQHGGRESSSYKREYLAQFVIDENLAIVPEWDDKYVEAVEPGPLHRYWHRYEAADLGVRDLTVVLFAYYDFQKATLVVEDEFVINGPELTTPRFSEGVRKKEEELGYTAGAGVYRRVADSNNLMLLQDLQVLHGLSFVPTSKDQLAAMVNVLRVMIGEGRVRVHPRCESLLGCLRSGVWRNEQYVGKEFARLGKLGHFDALAALVYMVRNLDMHTNPVPRTYNLNFNPTESWINPRMLERQGPLIDAVKRMFGRSEW